MTISRLAVHVPTIALDRFVGKSPKVKGKNFRFTCKRSINGTTIILFCKKGGRYLGKAVEGVSKRVGRRHYMLVPRRLISVQELSSMKLIEIS